MVSESKPAKSKVLAGRPGPLVTAIVASAIAACAAVGSYDEPAAGAAVVAMTALMVALRRQMAAERLAAALVRGGAAHPGSLMESLSRLAVELDAVEHRLADGHPITGLPMREQLVAVLDNDIEVGQGARLLGTIRFVDFDRLAAFDQPAANAALKQFAMRLTKAAKPQHVIAQIDRDCFAIWFGASDIANARAEFRALARVAGQDLEQGGARVTPALEVSVVSAPRDGADAAHLLLRARAALSPSGAGGRGEADFREILSPDVAREQYRLEQDLGQAIAENQLTMMFQPVLDLSLKAVVGAEALLRWKHPEHGSVSPAQFIPVVESAGLSERFGLWVLNAACREAKRWRDEGLPGLRVAVNLSAHQLLDPDLRTKIERTLERHSLSPRALELELTETAAMADRDRTVHLFRELRAMGVSLAIDDFGTGFSSLSYLKNLPFDKLKIDREFVTAVDQKRESRAICKSLIELGHGLGLQVLAEGVENIREVEALRGLGCTIFQGFHYSTPVSAEDFRALCRDPIWLSRHGLLGGSPVVQIKRRVSR